MSERYNCNKTAYWVYNGKPNLPVIIMIHGFRGTHHGLELIAKRLVGRYKIIIPDLPGFGDSEPLCDKHSIENYVTWLNNFISSLDLKEPPILFGHSFGSIITSYFCSEYPHMISHLVLVNPIGAPALEGPKKIMTKLALSYYWLGQALPQPIGNKLLSSKTSTLVMSVTMAKTKNRKLRKFIHNQHLTHFSSFSNRQSVGETFRTSVTCDVSQVAAKIKTPTLLIAGDKDDITPLSRQRDLTKLFPQAKLKVIENVGHLTHYETPDQVADFIIDELYEK